MTLISLCELPRRIQVGKREVRLVPGKDRLLLGWRGEALEITHENKRIGQIKVRNDGFGAFVLFVYEDEKGRLYSKNFLYELSE